MIPTAFLVSSSPSRPDDRVSDLSLEDQEWLEGFGRLLHSRVNFLIAQFTADVDLINRAVPDVLVWLDGRFSSVRELVDACGSHGCNTNIPEAWEWETAQHVRSLMDDLDVTSATAVKFHAQQLDCYEIDTPKMMQAIRAASRWLDGERAWD